VIRKYVIAILNIFFFFNIYENYTTTTSEKKKMNAVALKECIKALTAEAHASSLSNVPLNLFHDSVIEMMSGLATDAQMGAFLALLPPYRFTPEVVAECARAMRSQGIYVQLPNDLAVMDIVGTGGDGADSFNVSTACSFVVAAAGQPVVKHGNRSSSSKCGSADLIEASGAALELTAPQAIQCVTECSFAFLFAQSFHPMLRNIGPARKQLGCRTIFNVLGPLTNPCVPTYQLTGVYSRSLGHLFAASLHSLGVKRALIVHGHDGTDELSPSTTSSVWLLHSDGKIEEHTLSPSDFGLPTYTLEDVKSGSAVENVHILESVLKGVASPYLDWVLMNAAAALVVSEKASDWKDGVAKARAVISNGEALETYQRYVKLSSEIVATAKSKLTILETIAVHRKGLVNAAKSKCSMESLLFQSLRTPTIPLISIIQRLEHSGPMALMAEIKRASPSLGDINVAIDSVDLALKYAKGGAAAISVLTEPKWFKGSIEDLRKVRAALEHVPNRPAVLLKDFVLDEYQLVEARLAGADTALLIVAILGMNRLAALMHASRSMGMEPLVEVANADEMKIALDAGALLIGVNNRDLHTFSVDTTNTTRLSTVINEYYEANPTHPRIFLVALSGIKSRSDVEIYAKNGAKAVLVGETLMKSDDPTKAIGDLLGFSTVATTIVKPSPTTTCAKICGIRDVSSAIFAAEKGATMIGMIFAESKRQLSKDDARTIVLALHARFGYETKSIDDEVSQLTPSSIQSRQFHRPVTVGVFMNQSVEFINEISDYVGLDLIQLHGNEDNSIIPLLNRRVIRAIPVIPSQTSASDVIAQIPCDYASKLFAILLDTKIANMSGGTGVAFDWNIAAEVIRSTKVNILKFTYSDDISYLYLYIFLIFRMSFCHGSSSVSMLKTLHAIRTVTGEPLGTDTLCPNRRFACSCRCSPIFHSFIIIIFFSSHLVCSFFNYV
jgi:anthranilate phosphoribosyltransferase